MSKTYVIPNALPGFDVCVVVMVDDRPTFVYRPVVAWHVVVTDTADTPDITETWAVPVCSESVASDNFILRHPDGSILFNGDDEAFPKGREAEAVAQAVERLREETFPVEDTDDDDDWMIGAPAEACSGPCRCTGERPMGCGPEETTEQGSPKPKH